MTRLRIIGILLIIFALGIYFDYALMFSHTSFSKNSIIKYVADYIYLIIPAIIFGVLFIVLGRKEGWGQFGS
jgi:hypothetical protein